MLRPQTVLFGRSILTKQEKEEYKKQLSKAIKDLDNSNTKKDLVDLFVNLRRTSENVGEKAGFQKPLRIPRLLVADAYTVASDGFIAKNAKDFSSYHITFRRELTPWMKELGVKPKNSRYVFFGLQQIIKLLNDPVTHEEIDEAKKFLQTAKAGGKPFYFNEKMWRKIVDEHDGMLPIKIEALKDGAVGFPGEPMVQITAKDGFGELAAWFETKLLQVWATSERASLLRHWLDYLKNLVVECTDQPLLSDEETTAKAQRMMVDFSDRSSMTGEESTLLGLASLTSFPKTSTMSAAYLAYKESDNKPAASAAMYSLSHRAVQSYKREYWKAYDKLFEFTRGEAGSYVADCYDFRHDVKKHLIPLAVKAKKENTGNIIFARPDSGDDYIDQIIYALNLAAEKGLYKTIKSRSGQELKIMENFKVIYADGVNISKMKKINEALLKAGFSPPDCIAYGVGGYLHDSLSRSNLSAAQKLCAVDSNKTPVMKSPLTERGKESIPGLVKITRSKSGEPTVRRSNEKGINHLTTWYDGINGKGITYKEDFRNVQDRILWKFHEYPRPNKLYSRALTCQANKLRNFYRTLTAEK